MALSEARNTREVYCGAMTFTRVRSKKENTVLYPGALAASDSDGKVQPASDTAGLVVLGRYEGDANGKAVVRSGVFIYENGSNTEAITAGDTGKVCYVVDDATVGILGGTNSIPAGVIREVSPDGIAVEAGNLVLNYIPGHTHTASEITGLNQADA